MVSNNKPNPFKYPRSRHKRRLNPGPFSNYREYTPHLKEEFFARCVYCLIPDIYGISFEVEHYRPTSKFKDLETDYSNLFYSCRACNGRKSNKWFEPARNAAYIVNPCQDVMSKHLQYKDLKVAAQSKAGSLTEEVFRFNDSKTIEYRESIDLLLTDTWGKLVELRQRKRKINKVLKKERDLERIQKLKEALVTLQQEILKREMILQKIDSP